VAGTAANVATIGFLLAAVLQVLLALGVVPVTMAWGGTQPVLTAPLRTASLAAVVVFGLAACVIRRRARPHPSRPINVLAWAIAVLLAVNTAGNFASRSTGEAALFGPLSLLLALSCLLVAASRQPNRANEFR
jgi:hypothetical protein